ncbi:MAG: hypothetical protein VYB61_10840 [Verrucomicrobiota bacterium]|nr:hypothetical protein [Verrucomicrobiota bacterium]
MARQENLFNCPMCGRPAEVPSRYAGKVFVHSICGSTLRMVVPNTGEAGLELISRPELEENSTIDLEAITKSESGGLFLPRHLRKKQHGDGGIGRAMAARVSSEESPGKASASLTKALSRPAETTVSRLREVRLTRDRSKSSRLRARFSRTVDDLPTDHYRHTKGGRTGGRARRLEVQQISVGGEQRPDCSLPATINPVGKVIIVASALMVIVAVMFMMFRFLATG